MEFILRHFVKFSPKVLLCKILGAAQDRNVSWLLLQNESRLRIGGTFHLLVIKAA